MHKARDAQADMELKKIVGQRIADIQLRCQADLKEYEGIEKEIMGLDYTKKRILLLLQQKPIFDQIEGLFAEQPDRHEALFAGFVAQARGLIRRELDKPEGLDQLSLCEKARLLMPRPSFPVSRCRSATFGASSVETFGELSLPEPRVFLKTL